MATLSLSSLSDCISLARAIDVSIARRRPVGCASGACAIGPSTSPEGCSRAKRAPLATCISQNKPPEQRRPNQS
eukprot:2823106-Pyramimonas_sp.AAC.1